MYSEMDCVWMGHSMSPTTPAYSPPILQECDIVLVKKSLELIIDCIDKQNRLIPEYNQLVCAFSNYVEECNKAFLASEHISNFLILCLCANLIITFIVLVSVPVSLLSISLVCFASLILFCLNLFTLYHQAQGFEQENARNILTKCNKDLKQVINSKNLQSNSIFKLKKVRSPTSTICLFPAQKIPENDELKQAIDENSLNDSDFLPTKLSNQH